MENVKIGWAIREISMDGPVSIPGQGYLRISQGIHDPLYATVLVVDGGKEQDAVIFCSCDVVVLSRGTEDMIAEMVAKTHPEIPMGNLVANATHTHSSMNYWSDCEESVSGEAMLNGLKTVRPHIARKVAEAICEAWDNRREGGIGYGYGYAVVGHSRRVCYSEDMSRIGGVMSMAPNGHAIMYGNTNRPAFSHYEAGADHFLNLMFTFDPAKKLTGIIVNVPCPSQLSEHFKVLSADYWTEVRALVKKEFGEDVFVLPQCAAAGDLSPRILHYREAQVRRMALKYGLHYDYTKAYLHGQDEYNKVMAERYDIAERILEGIKDVYSWAKKDIKTAVPVRHVCREMQVERRMITEAEKAWCEENIEAMRQQIPDKEHGTPEQIRIAVSQYESIKGRNERAIARFEAQKEEPTLPQKFHVVQIDDICFSTTRFELFQDFMHRLQARSPFIQTFVIQMGGEEESCYLSTERAQANKGYSASLFCNQVSAFGGQQWVEESLKILNEMKEA